MFLNTKFPRVLFGLTILGLLYAVFNSLTPDTIPFSDDGAFAFAIGRYLKNGELLLAGLPSHLGGRHLGPLYLWYVQIGSWLGGGEVQLTTLIFAALKLIAVIFTLISISMLSNESEKPWAAVGAVICVASSFYVWIIRTPWANHFLFILAALLLLATLLTLKHGRKALLLYLLAASGALQAHLSTTPTIIAFSLVVFVNLILKRNELRPASPRLFDQRCFQLLCVVLIVLLWLPPLLYEIKFESNFLNLATVHLNATHEQAGLGQACLVFLGFFSRLIFGLGAYDGLTTKLPPLLIIVFWIAAIALTLSFLRSRTALQRWYFASIAMAVLFSLLFLARLEAPLHHYYLNSLLPLPAIFWGVLIGHSAALIIKSLSNRSKSFDSLRLAASFFIIWIILLTPFLYLNTQAKVQDLPELEKLSHAEAVAKIISIDRGSTRDLQIFVRGREKLRKNAYYYLLGDDYLHMMQYHSTFKELTDLNHRQRNPEIAYLMVCAASEKRRSKRDWQKIEKKWQFDYAIRLEKCSTCGSCRLSRLKLR